ncbi:hypothetical protein NKG94_01010 [Micromonospora sp. M12]
MGVVGTAAGAVIDGLGGRDGAPAAVPAGGAAGAMESTAPAPPAHPCLDDAASGTAEPLQEPAGPLPYALPNGWTWHQDAGGFLLAVPVGGPGTPRARWCASATRRGTGHRRRPRSRSVLRTVEAVGGCGARRAGHRALPGYQRISIGPVIRPGGAAEWEYTCDQGDGARLHARRLLVNDSRSRAHSLSWITQDRQWNETEPLQRLALASFRLD